MLFLKLFEVGCVYQIQWLANYFHWLFGFTQCERWLTLNLNLLATISPMKFRHAITSLSVLCLLPLALSAQATSETNEKLKAALEKYPQADLNGDGLLTWAEAKKYRDQMRSSQQSGKSAPLGYPVEPTHPELVYGPYERNQLDLWQANVSEPAPIIIYIHGGGFVGGSKEKAARVTFIEQALAEGIHFASINYRYQYRSVEDLDDPQRTGTPGCFLDGARAVQYLRANAAQWKIDPDKVIVFGSSAGGGISLFLGANDDLADPDSEDPILRESSQVQGVGHFSSQPTYNFERWPDILGLSEAELKKVINPNKQTVPGHVKLGLQSEAEVDSEIGRRYAAMLDMTANIDPSDPPMFIYNNSGLRHPTSHGQTVHHVKLSIYLEEQLKANDVPAQRLFPRLDELEQTDPYEAFYQWCRQLLAAKSQA